MEGNFTAMTEEEKTDMFALLSNHFSGFSPVAKKSLDSQGLQSTYSRLSQEIEEVKTSLALEKQRSEEEIRQLQKLQSTVQPGTPLREVLARLKNSPQDS